MRKFRRKKLRRRVDSDNEEVSLPNKLSEPSERLQDYVTLIFGREKIGKTTLTRHFPDMFHAMFEEGGRALRIRQRRVQTWSEWLQYMKLLVKDKEFSNVSIDTADKAFDACQQYVCRLGGVTHPSESDDFGKTWNDLFLQFDRTVDRLLKTGKGVFFISHAREHKIKHRKGEDYDRIVPSMPNQARKVIEPLVDIWAYYCYGSNGERRLQIQGDDVVAAGHRLEERFIDSDTGEPLKFIPMGSSSKESYENFQAAFNNELANKKGGTKILRVRSSKRIKIRR